MSQVSGMQKPANLITAAGYALNVPALVIWLAVGLRLSGAPLGEALADWLYANFSEVALVIFWVGLPSSALVLGLGAFALGQKKWLSFVLIGLSSALLLLIALAATARAS